MSASNNVMKAFNEGAGFDSSTMQIVIITATLLVAFLWAIWTIYGYYKLYINSTIDSGALAWSTLKVGMILSIMLVLLYVT